MLGPNEQEQAEITSRDWFNTTHWTTVLVAADHGSQRSVEALETLCRTYWYPLYAYVRRRGYTVHDAEDLIQEFFARFLAKDYLSRLQREKGKFRFYLLSALNHFLADVWDREQCVKRGGGQALVPIDVEIGEARYRREPLDNASPDRLYERRWALTVLTQVLNRLEQEYRQRRQDPLFHALKEFITADPERVSYAAAAHALSLSEGALRVKVHRLRRRYGVLFRMEIAHTVSSPEEVEDEMRHLLDVLGG
jgi:DNA-directed RNA polymerase specialized sigma24 family protein